MYLINKVNSTRRQHLWDSEKKDSYCGMFTNGGGYKDQWVRKPEAANVEVCKMCLALSKTKPIKVKPPAVKKKGHKAKRQRVSKQDHDRFTLSREWRELRYRFIKNNEAKCMACGRSPQHHGIAIHVDHIKPRSKYKHLSLDYNNLQILCECCNIGKSNKDETDWRPSEEDATERLDVDHLMTINQHL